MGRNDGKYLEQSVSNYYETLKDPEIFMHRFNDSGAARNLTAAQPSDFLVIVRGKGTFLECKSIKHQYRLKKFAQHSRINRAATAGTPGLLLVHHSVDDFYRVVPVAELDIGQSSFDLSQYNILTFEESMRRIFG